jgi:hypothetical protein
MYGEVGDYQKTANDEILVMPMIETRQAVENIDEIVDVPGIDAIYVGPADLAFSLGKTPKLDSEDSEQLGMYESVLAACRKRAIYPGIHCGEPAYAARMIRMGFRLTTIANDSGLMAKAFQVRKPSCRHGGDRDRAAYMNGGTLLYWCKERVGAMKGFMVVGLGVAARPNRRLHHPAGKSPRSERRHRSLRRHWRLRTARPVSRRRPID